MTTVEYLSTAETTRPRELAYGLLREPPAPFVSHQRIVLRIARLLSDHVEPRRLGEVVLSPADVILDRERALVVQPDVLFVSTDRRPIVRNQVWGAPDLVVEVLSPGTESHDRGEKLEWYRRYGVRECWLVDAFAEQVVVVDFAGPEPVRRVAGGADTIRSGVFADLNLSAGRLFE